MLVSALMLMWTAQPVPATNGSAPAAATKRVCRTEQEIHSRIPRRICRTQAEWDEISRDAAESMRRTRPAIKN